MTVETRIHRHLDGRLTFARVQDVEPVLERNKAQQNEGKGVDGFRLIARVPCVTIEKWLNEEGAPVLQSGPEFAAFIRKKLNDPDWRFLKTTSGRI